MREREVLEIPFCRLWNWRSNRPFFFSFASLARKMIFLLRSGNFKSHQQNLTLAGERTNANKSRQRTKRENEMEIHRCFFWVNRELAVEWDDVATRENMLACGDDESAEIHIFSHSMCSLLCSHNIWWRYQLAYQQ